MSEITEVLIGKTCIECGEQAMLSFPTELERIFLCQGCAQNALHRTEELHEGMLEAAKFFRQGGKAN
jgi:hypothetical protein